MIAVEEIRPLSEYSDAEFLVELCEAAGSPRGATPQERAFEREVRRAQLLYRQAHNEALALTDEAMRQYRDSVVASFAGVTEWDEYYQAQVLAALNDASAVARRILDQRWKEAATRASALSLMSVEAPLSALGLPVASLPPATPIPQLAVLNNYVPSLIQQVTDEVQKKVQNLLQHAMLGGLDTRGMVDQIGDVVGPLKPGQRAPRTIFSRAEIRARNIMRTETNRLHNLTHDSRIRELAAKFPGVGEKWIHRPSNEPRPRHAALHGQVIYPGVEGKPSTFNVGGTEAKGPHDPKLPPGESINCHCGLQVVYDAEAGQDSVQDSPYVAGDGKDIPSAGQ